MGIRHKDAAAKAFAGWLEVAKCDGEADDCEEALLSALRETPTQALADVAARYVEINEEAGEDWDGFDQEALDDCVSNLAELIAEAKEEATA